MWFAKFHARHFLLDNVPWLGRPVEVDSDLIKTLIENDQPYTMWEIAYIPKTSKSIKLLVKMKNVSFISWKNPYGHCGNPIVSMCMPLTLLSPQLTVFPVNSL